MFPAIAPLYVLPRSSLLASHSVGGFPGASWVCVNISANLNDSYSSKTEDDYSLSRSYMDYRALPIHMTDVIVLLVYQ